MEQTYQTQQIETEAKAELRRAVRDFPSVEIVGAGEDGLTLQGERESIREVTRALWTRELSARDYGQESLASADASVRAQIEQAT